MEMVVEPETGARMNVDVTPRDKLSTAMGSRCSGLPWRLRAGGDMMLCCRGGVVCGVVVGLVVGDACWLSTHPRLSGS